MKGKFGKTSKVSKYYENGRTVVGLHHANFLRNLIHPSQVQRDFLDFEITCF